MNADIVFPEGQIRQVVEIKLKSAFEQSYGGRGWQRQLYAVLAP